jgi:hypothetical protein
VAVGAFVLAPLGKVAVEVGFVGFFEEVSEATFAVGLPLLEEVAGEDKLPALICDGDQGEDSVRAVALGPELYGAVGGGLKDSFTG